jgi:DNA repair protein RadC
MKQSFTVRDLPVEERPRERLAKFGAESLSAQELLSLILGRGVRGESVMMTAQKLVSKFGSLQGVTEASLEELKQVNGIGTAKAAQIKACLEIGRRARVQNGVHNKEIKEQNERITSPQRVHELVKDRLRNYAKEHFFVLSFDVRNKLLGIDIISVGTLTASLVHPREAFEAAIRRHADHIIVAHNHPSQDLEPSQEDRDVTRLLAESGKVLGIALVDHCIVGTDGYISFKEQGLL